MHERRRYPKATENETFPRNQIRSPTGASSKLHVFHRHLTRLQHMDWKPPTTLGLWTSRALLLTVAAMYSTNFAVIKYLETLCLHPPCVHDPSEATFCRFLVSALVCLPILYSNRRHWPVIRAGLECGCCMSLNYICMAEALEYIPAGKCAFISSLSVAVVPLAAGLLFGKKIGRMTIVSALLALLGVAILENLIPIVKYNTLAAPPPTPEGALMFGWNKGDLLALGQPIGCALTITRIEHYVEKFSHIPNRVLTLSAAQCVSVCFLCFLWVLFDADGSFPDLTYMLETHRLVALLWIGVVTTVLALILQGIALQKASSTDASLIFSTEPVWGSLFAGWLLQESLSYTTYVGGAFILAACVLGSFQEGPANETSAATRNARRFKKKSSDVAMTDLPWRLNSHMEDGDKSHEVSMPSLLDIPISPTRKKESTPIVSNCKIQALL